MNVYPETETFIITWHGGTCGAFVTSLITLLLHDEIIIENFSINGNSHFIYKHCMKNHRHINDHFSMIRDQSYKNIEPIDPTKPLILYDHVLPVDYNFLKEKFPKFKNLIITYTRSDLPHMHGNLFWKSMVESFYNEELPDEKKGWYILRNKYPDQMKNILTPEHLTPGDAEKIIRLISNNKSCIDKTKIYKIIGEKNVLDKVYFLEFSEIFKNKNKVLTLLSFITQKTVTDKIVRFYDDYLKAQELLIATKMPWLKA